jgi:hypothetical protein
MTSNALNSRYRHLYVVVRVDAYQPPEDCFSLVSAWWEEGDALTEADRLNRIGNLKSLYVVNVTRLKSTTSPEE